MDVEVVRRAGHLDCARTSAQYGAADAREGARITYLGGGPRYTREGGTLGWPPVEGPRYRGSGPLWRTAAPDVVSRSRRIGEVGGCESVHSWASAVAP